MEEMLGTTPALMQDDSMAYRDGDDHHYAPQPAGIWTFHTNCSSGSLLANGTANCSQSDMAAVGNVTGWMAGGDGGGPTLMELLSREAAFRWAMTLVTWLFPVVVLVGLGGNVCSFWVLLRRCMRRTSACR
jgi:hypothetical protein